MSIKDLFDKNKPKKLLTSATMENLGDQVESDALIDAKVIEQDRVVPQVDYADPANFTKFGSAEEYYVKSIERVYKTYPYDGSEAEKVAWHNSSSYLDEYIFDNLYPRTNGIAVFAPSGWGSVSAHDSGYALPSTQEYIFTRGGPNQSPDTGEIKKQFVDFESRHTSGSIASNVYDLAQNRESNLKIGGIDGNTVEFWLKKDAFTYDGVASTARYETIFDVYTTSSISSSVNYGRLSVELDGNAGASPFIVTYMSGTNGLEREVVGSGLTKATVADGNWHHYAVTFKNTGSLGAVETKSLGHQGDMKGIEVQLYVDGAYNSKILTGSTVSYVSGALISTVASLAHRPSASTATEFQRVDRGYGKLSGSLDDLRFWKDKRDGQEVGRFWRTNVFGGTNTDTANTQLGVYYKFNEGITGTSSIDSNVLDYSGRVSNGAWTGYSSDSRQTVSAIVQSSASATEFKDPILYSAHTEVSSLKESKQLEGRNYDDLNPSSLYNSMPEWINSQDERGNLLSLTQIMASYLDEVSLQIKTLPSLKNVNYLSSSATSSQKPYPFMNRVLENVGFNTPEIFVDSDVVEQFLDLDDHRIYEKNLTDIKNLIYQNIYNNLNYIYKSKGTEKAFRNLIRCFGVDDELIALNLYAADTKFELRDNLKETSLKKNYVNFNHASNIGAVVYQYSSSANPNSVSYLSGSDSDFYENGLAMTFESEVIAPKALNLQGTSFYHYPHYSASFFGVHTADVSNVYAQTAVQNGTQTTWAASDVANFQVYLVRETLATKDAYFMLTSSAGAPAFPLLTSSVFKGVYDNEKWNVSVRIKPKTFPWADKIDGSTDSTSDQYDIEFYGVNMASDIKQNSFRLTGSITKTNGDNFLKKPKRVYVGAHRTNFTGSILTNSDLRISSTRVWYDHLSDDVLDAHARDAANFGAERPYESAFLFQTDQTNLRVPQIDTLVLNWNFLNVTSSNTSGQFAVDDFSSGSADDRGRYEWFGNLSENQHMGKGFGFLASTTASFDVNYVNSMQKQLPETINSSDMVNIMDNDDIAFTRESRPTRYFFSFEKSMYRTISQEMMKFFATVAEFNNLIGEPVNRYRMRYKNMEKLRQLFYERVANTPELDKYIDYYKWIDSALSEMIVQLFPASADISDGIRTIVESHVLERNKYWSKYPTLDRNEGNRGKPIQGSMKPIGFKSTSDMMDHYGMSSPGGSPGGTGDYLSVSPPSGDRTGGTNANTDGTGQKWNPEVSSDVRSLRKVINKNETAGFFSRNTKYFKQKDLADSKETWVKKERALKGGSDDGLNSQTLFSTAPSKDNDNKITLVGNTIDLTIEEKPGFRDDLVKKTRVTPDVTKGREGSYGNTKNNLKGIASIYSSSVGLQFTNIHQDLGPALSADQPIQSPFTSKYVGGFIHRDQPISSGSVNITSRPELFRITGDASDLTSTDVKILSPDLNLSETQDFNLPRAMYSKGTKSPINIENLQQATGSATQKTTVIGNYDKKYDYFQTSGRSINNKYFISVEGQIATSSAEVFALSGVIDFALPTRPRTETIFAEHFSAPGGPETLSRGFLDTESEQFSVYNALPFRNLVVRQPLQTLLTRHCGQFGYDSAIGSPSASYQKVNRNTKRRIQWSGSSDYDTSNQTTAVLTASVYDNWWVQHAIPQSEYQYGWITSSAFVNIARLDGYTSYAPTYDGLVSGSTAFVEAIEFISASTDATDGINVDFVGLNTLIYDPITASTNTLSSSTDEYRNTDFATLPAVDEFNALMLHRNGPFGYASWQQTRGQENALVRFQRQNNQFDILRTETVLPRTLDKRWTYRNPYDKSATVKQKRPLNRFFKSFTIPPLTSKFKPMDSDVQDHDGNVVSLKHAYGNNLDFMPVEEINLALGINTEDSKGNQVYDFLKTEIVQDKSIEFRAFRYNETIYPREENTFLAKVRGRINYSNETTYTNLNKAPLGRQAGNTRTFWRDSRSDRVSYVVTNSFGYNMYFDGIADGVNYFGVWPFDMPYPINTGNTASFQYGTNSDVFQGDLSSNQGFKSISYKTARLPTASIGPWWRAGIIATTAEAMQGRPIIQTQLLAGRNPYYDSYEDYASDIRVFAQDHTVLPEFRISEHMSHYINDGFLAENKKFLTLLGGATSPTASSDSSTGSFSQDFFKVYSHSDFMQHFETVKNDYKDVAKPSEITFKCSGIKKLLPYQGFYPALRTSQLATLFSQSVGPHIPTGSNVNRGGPFQDDGKAERLQSITQPFFAPGVLFNTIKSGLAVDWPMMTGSYPEVTPAFTFFSIKYGGIISSGSNFRLPFEALIDLERYLPVSSSDGQGSLYGLDPYRFNVVGGNIASPYAVWNGSKDNYYELAMHNFLGEIPKFFLKNERLNTYTSAQQSQFKPMRSGSTYYMDVVLHKTDDMIMSEGDRGYLTGSATSDVTQRIQYRGRTYGPPFATTASADATYLTKSVADTALNPDGWTFTSFDPSQAPYTPPYFYGKARARLTFKPHQHDEMGEDEIRTFSLDDILAGARITSTYESEFDWSTSRFAGDDTIYPAQLDQMQVSSSVNLFGKTRVKKVEYSTDLGPEGNYVPVSVTDTDNTSFDVWSISPKFECPVLNFSGNYHPTASFVNMGGGKYPGTFGNGMWGGYGEFPTGSTGIWISLEESYPSIVNKPDRSNLTGSLIDICGFIPKQNRIGDIADEKVISEAIVAIPFIEKKGKRRFFPLLRRQIDYALGTLTPKQTELLAKQGNLPGQSIVDMVETMQNYYVPPQFDFITNRSVKPFAMYIFEFEHTLNKTDLANIWQGVMPAIAVTAERDNVEISHKLEKGELLGADLPTDTRWMVFKIKRKAEKSYYAITADSQDDTRFAFEFNLGSEKVVPNYNYNWPYDFFSLVELGKLDAEIGFEKIEDKE